jgi:hypothetical protein
MQTDEKGKYFRECAFFKEIEDRCRKLKSPAIFIFDEFHVYLGAKNN